MPPKSKSPRTGLGSQVGGRPGRGEKRQPGWPSASVGSLRLKCTMSRDVAMYVSYPVPSYCRYTARHRPAAASPGSRTSCMTSTVEPLLLCGQVKGFRQMGGMIQSG